MPLNNLKTTIGALAVANRKDGRAYTADVEQLSMGFVQEPTWISFAASAVITALISGTIHFFAFRKIRSLKLSDIQK